jgi:hypothetical protein
MKQGIRKPIFADGERVVRSVGEKKIVTLKGTPEWNGTTFMYACEEDAMRCGEDYLRITLKEDAVAQELAPRALEREKYETTKDFASRLLASMFQEVFAHTGREMPAEMFDRVSDFTTQMLDAVYDTYHVEGRSL